MEEKKWNGCRLCREVPLDECGSPVKMIKLSDVHQQLEEKYLPERISHYSVSQIARKAFPNAESKIASKSRTKHIAGITPVHTVTMEGISTSEADEARAPSGSQCVLLETERAKNKQLTERLLLLEARVQELERTSLATLTQQADQLQHSSLIAHGPDTPDHFRDFSVDGVIHELQEYAPDIYRLFLHLGNVQQDVHCDGSNNTEEVKAVTSIDLHTLECQIYKGEGDTASHKHDANS